MQDTTPPKNGVAGWELYQFLPEDEELFDFETPPPEITANVPKKLASENPLENALKGHYRFVLARNRQKLLMAQKHLVRSRVSLHEAYLLKMKQLAEPLPALQEKEFLVTATTNGPAVHTLSGDRQPISWGHIMTGFEWGIEYVLDPATFSYHDRQTYLERLYRHRLALLDAEHELLELLTDAYKDESADMAEAAKAYRDRYRALFDIETGNRQANAHLPEARAIKIIRAFLIGLSYDFPALGISLRTAHPIEEVGYGVHYILTRHETDPENLAPISVIELASRLQALNNLVVVKHRVLEPHLSRAILNSEAWNKKLDLHNHAHKKTIELHSNFTEINRAFSEWEALSDPLAHALETPDKHLGRDFWAGVVGGVFTPLLTAAERQLIVSSL